MSTQWVSHLWTTGASPYAAGQQIGVPVKLGLKLQENENVRLLDLILIDKSKQMKKIDVMLFGKDPAPTSGDGQAVSISYENLQHCCGTVMLLPCDYVDLGGAAVASLGGIVRGVDAVQSRSVYAVAVAREGLTVAAGDLFFKFYCAKDYS